LSVSIASTVHSWHRRRGSPEYRRLLTETAFWAPRYRNHNLDLVELLIGNRSNFLLVEVTFRIFWFDSFLVFIAHSRLSISSDLEHLAVSVILCLDKDGMMIARCPNLCNEIDVVRHGRFLASKRQRQIDSGFLGLLTFDLGAECNII